MTASDHTWLLTVAAAALWPGAPNPAPHSTWLQRCPSPSPSFDSTSITSSSKRAAAVWAADTERESWASRMNPTLSVPTTSSCATPISYKEKGRGIMVSEAHRKITWKDKSHSKHWGWGHGTESFISTSACFHVEKNPRSEKRGCTSHFSNFILFSFRERQPNHDWKPLHPHPVQPSPAAEEFWRPNPFLPSHIRAHAGGPRHHTKLRLDFSLCSLTFDAAH